jgi:hypothetical protein
VNAALSNISDDNHKFNVKLILHIYPDMTENLNEMLLQSAEELIFQL